MNRSESNEIEALLVDAAWMRGLARRLVFDADVAEDVVQDAWVAALEHRARVRGGVAGYLAGAIRNLTSQHHRRELRRRRREAAAAELASTAADDVTDLVARADRQRALTTKVLALPDPYRRVVLLRFFEGLSQREIAARTDTPRATVNSQLTRALALLREDLDREHDGDRAAWMAAMAPLAASSSGLGTLTAGVLIMKSKSPLFVSVIVLLIAALPVAWWAWGDAAAPEFAEPAPPAAARVAAETPPSIDPPPVREAAAPAPREPAPEVAPLLPEPPDEAPRVVIRALRAADRAPVAGARVLVVGASLLASPEYQEASALARVGGVGSIEDLLARVAWKAQTDGAGEARVPVDGRTQVWVTTSDAFGEASLGAGRRSVAAEQVVEVSMEARRHARARVVDEAGAPVADVAVTFRVRQVAESPWIDLGTQRTGPEGEVGFLLNPYSGLLTGYGAEVRLALAAPLAEPVERKVSPQGAAEAVTLALPATSRVRVRVEDARGASVPDGTLVRLRKTEEAVGDDELPAAALLWMGEEPVVVERTKDGVARFDVVGPGLDLEALAFHPANQAPARATLRSAATAGEEVAVTVRIERRSVAVTARLVDAASEAWTGARVQVQLGDDETRGLAVTTDRAGRFVCDVPEEAWDAGELRLSLADDPAADPVSVALPPRGAEGAPDDASSEVPPPTVDLGEIVLRRGAARASGVVLDASGAPVEGACVYVVGGDPTRDDSGWKETALVYRTDASGRFEVLHVPPQGATAFLVARRYIGALDDAELGPLPFQPRSDLRFVLSAAHDLVGRLLVDPGVPATRIRVQAWADADGERPSAEAYGWATGQVLADGTFRIPDLAPGRYTVAVTAGFGDESPTMVHGVGVDVPEARDPRLDPLDLRGRFQVLSLTVVDEEGDHVDARAYSFREHGGVVAQLGGARRPFLIPADDGVVGVVVEAEGYVPAWVQAAEGAHRVVLARGIEVEVAWPASDPFPPTPLQEFVELRPTAVMSGVPRGAASFLLRAGPTRAASGPDRIAHLRVAAPGQYTARVVIERDRDGYVDAEVVSDLKVEPRLLVNPPGAAPQRFDATLVPGAAAAAIETLGATR